MGKLQSVKVPLFFMRDVVIMTCKFTELTYIGMWLKRDHSGAKLTLSDRFSTLS